MQILSCTTSLKTNRTCHHVMYVMSSWRLQSIKKVIVPSFMTNCSVLQAFFVSIAFKYKNESEYALVMGDDCCQSAFFECDDHGAVTSWLLTEYSLQGDLTEFEFPSSLTTLDLSGNYFTGSVKLDSIQHLNMVGNPVYDVTVNDPSSLVTCDLSGTIITGEQSKYESYGCQINPGPLAVQCQKMQQFFETTNLKELKPNEHALVNSQDCCRAKSIVCIFGVIDSIMVDFEGLTGDLNKLELFDSIKRVTLLFNKLEGKFPTLPDGILQFRTRGSKITDGLPKSLPSSMSSFDCVDCHVSGNIPVLHEGLKGFNLSQNALSGGIPTAWPTTLTLLDLSKNQFSGALPTLPTAFAFKVNDNHFSGALAFQKPAVVDVANNKFTSITIDDTSRLRTCNLQNNQFDYAALSSLSPLCTLDEVEDDTEYIVMGNEPMETEVIYNDAENGVDHSSEDHIAAEHNAENNGANNSSADAKESNQSPGDEETFSVSSSVSMVFMSFLIFQ